MNIEFINCDNIEYEEEIIIKPSSKKRSRLIYQELNYTDKLIDIFNKNKNKYGNMKDTGKDFNSISYLINKQLSQSQCIKFGIIMEKLLLDIILEYNHNLKNIKQKIKNGNREKDHLLIDDKNMIIYYAEIKSNINLDTEKSKETSNKCIDIYNELKNMYNEYKINMYLVGIRYYTKDIIPKIILNKYNNIKEHVIGINEYLYNLNCDIKFDNDSYQIFINKIVDELF